MTTIEIAEFLVDLHYKDFQDENDFINVDHYEIMVCATGAALLQREFERSKVMSAQEEGIFMAQINPEWFIETTLDVSMQGGRYIATLPTEIFTFRFDKQSSQILDVLSVPGECHDFIRISPRRKWEIKHYPESSKIYWFVLGLVIEFLKMKVPVRQVIVPYIPAFKIGKATEVSQSFAEEIIKTITAFMEEVLNGKIIGMSNDQNPNKTLETEVSQFVAGR